MFKNYLLLTCLLAIFILVGCNNTPPDNATEAAPDAITAEPADTPEPEETQSSESSGPSEGYPGPGAAEAYPGGEGSEGTSQSNGTVAEVPEPSSEDVGVVTGILMVGQDAGKPVPEVILYLGRIITLENGQPGMSALDKQTAPNTQTNGAGQFIFTDIAPGTYTLVLDRVTDSFLLNSPETGGDLLIEVKAGEITDLGELRYEQLPVELSE